MARPQSESTRTILKRFKEGATVNEIAKELDLAYTGVYSALMRNGVKVRRNGKTNTTATKKQDTKTTRKPVVETVAKATRKKNGRKTTKKSVPAVFTVLDTPEPTITSATGTLAITPDPSPLVSAYLPVTAQSLSRKLADQLTYLKSRVVEVEKIKAAVDKL